MLRKFKAWRRKRSLRCRISEEWCGLFIGRRYCSTHRVYWDAPVQDCPKREV